MKVNSPQILAFRLRRQHLLDRRPAQLIKVCSDVCGIQAQVSSWAEMALWARIHELRRAQIAEALWGERTLIKTWLMRQTLHWIPTQEFTTYIYALRESRTAALMRIMSKFGITRKEWEQLNQALVDELKWRTHAESAVDRHDSAQDESSPKDVDGEGVEPIQTSPCGWFDLPCKGSGRGSGFCSR